MRHLVLLAALMALTAGGLTACGYKGPLKTPTQMKIDEEKKARQEEKRRQREAKRAEEAEKEEQQ